MGLAEPGTIAVDGTKAYASRHEAMSCGHMLEAAAELKSQVEAPLNMARTADEAEENESGLDISAEPARRRNQLDALVAARTTPEQRRRDADLERERSDDDDQGPTTRTVNPKARKGARQKRPFGVPHHEDQELHLSRRPQHAARWRRARHQNVEPRVKAPNGLDRGGPECAEIEHSQAAGGCCTYAYVFCRRPVRLHHLAWVDCSLFTNVPSRKPAPCCQPFVQLTRRASRPVDQCAHPAGIQV